MTVAYFILISAGGESEYRFRVPILPQYMIAAAAGVEAITRSARRPQRGVGLRALAKLPIARAATVMSNGDDLDCVLENSVDKIKREVQ